MSTDDSFAPPEHVDRVEQSALLLERALFEVKRVLVGQDAMVERMIVGLLARGHLLLEGVPGVAKTLAVRTLAEITGGSFTRLQFTPDLMPGDIVGTRVWRPSTESFDTELGPVFANLVLADEINRAPAKVQSALLEAMAEGQVSVGGTTYPLPKPFLVLATQNPIESEGVYQLPEAQRDRFLMKVDVGYPDESEELAILQRMSVNPPRGREVLSTEQVLALQEASDRVFVHHAVAQYAVALVMTTREPARRGLDAVARRVEFGASPRGTLGLVAAARVMALMRGRDYVLPRDVADIASDVLSHRLVLSFDAIAEGVDPRQIVDYLVAVVPQPQIAPHDDASRATQSAEPPGSRCGVRSLAQSLHAFAALDLTVRKRLAGLLHGDHEGLRLGSGSDAEEVVRYRPGEDDVRRIDWNVTARSSEPHVWRTRAEHEVKTWVLVDETASMDFGTAEVEKADLATWVTGAVGLLSDGPGNRVGVAHLGADGVHWSRPLPPRRAAVRMMSRDRPRPAASTPTPGGLADAIALLDARYRRRGVRVVVSDFVEPDGNVERPFAWEAPLRRLSARHEVLVIEVVDPRELSLPDVGPVVLVDPETGHRCEVWTSNPLLREQYAAVAAYHRAAVAQAVHAARAHHLVVRTDRDWVSDLARFVTRRRRPRHGAPLPGSPR